MPKRNIRTRDRKTIAGKHFDLQVKNLRKGPRVKIGVTQEKFDDPKKGSEGGFTLGEIAAVNEFGTAVNEFGTAVNEFGTAGRPFIPERSFIRSTHDEKKKTMIAFINRLRHEVLARRMSTRTALGKVGNLMKGFIQNKIITLKDPPNAPSTIAAKTRAGKIGDNPLIDTGQLLRSIEFEIKGTGK